MRLTFVEFRGFWPRRVSLGGCPRLCRPDADYARSIGAIAQAMTGDVQNSVEERESLGVHYEGPFVNSSQCGAYTHAILSNILRR